MAITIISQPTAGQLHSASFPLIVEMSSDKVLDPNIQQHRFYIDITVDLIFLVRKYTVAIEGNIGTVDVSNIIREAIQLSAFGDNSEEITKTTLPRYSLSLYKNAVSCQTGEIYFDGVDEINESGPVVAFDAFRGFSDLIGQSEYLFKYANWYEFNLLLNFIPYSGFEKLVYPMRTDRGTWPAIGTKPYFNIWVSTNLWAGAYLTGTWFARGGDAILYHPLFIAGRTDIAGFTNINLRVDVADDVAGANPVYSGTAVQVNKNIFDVDCPDDEVVVMFRDRFNNWAFVSFTKKRFQTQQRESNIFRDFETGLENFDIKTADRWRLNTDWVDESQNDLFADLARANKCYILADDGALTQMIVRDNAFNYRTLRNDRLVQYEFTLEQSIYNFAV